MYLAIFLHIYQPPTQLPGVTEKIAQDCYLKIVALLEEYPQCPVTININASLTEQLAEGGYGDLLARIKRLVKLGQVELTSSAAYHAFLPELPKEEIYRQIELNECINSKYLGPGYDPSGFFPPEMAYSPRLKSILESLRFKWLVLDQYALQQPTDENIRKPFDTLFKVEGSSLKVFFRHNVLSLDVAFGRISTETDFFSTLDLESQGYMILALDGETFGHHRPEQLSLLGDIFSHSLEYANLNLTTISGLLDNSYSEKMVDPLRSTWGPKTRWNNPNNLLHRLQWQLANLAIGVVNDSGYSLRGVYSKDSLAGKELSIEQENWLEARFMLDKALHSDQFFWAGADPVWHPEMVKRGVEALLKAINSVPDVPREKVAFARQLGERIISNGLRLYGSQAIIS
jgi:hypothetical protein